MFAEEGASVVVIADLPGTEARSVAEEIGPVARFAPLDVTDADSMDFARGSDTAEYARVDVLVNNAGVWLAKGLTETSPEEYRRVVEVNQTGVFLGMWTVAPLMREARSGLDRKHQLQRGFRGGGMPHAYAASKWAVRGMSRAAAWELAPYGVRVNVVCPGFIDTPMIEGGKEVLEQLAALSPSGRVGTPDEVARLVAFLASDTSSYISGAEVAIDGAYTA